MAENKTNATSAPNPKMLFGHYAGQNLSDCPVEYLDWLIGQDWLKQPLKNQVTAHLKTRADWNRLDDE